MEAEDQEIDSLKVIPWKDIPSGTVKLWGTATVQPAAPVELSVVLTRLEVFCHSLAPLPFGGPSQPRPSNPQSPPQSPALTVGLINALKQPKNIIAPTCLGLNKFQALVSAFK